MVFNIKTDDGKEFLDGTCKIVDTNNCISRRRIYIYIVISISDNNNKML